MIFRVRTYSSLNSDAWEGGDRKKWSAATQAGSREEVLKKWMDGLIEMNKITSAINGTKPLNPDFVMIDGDFNKMTEAMRAGLPWMHRKEVPLKT
jgi:hypothetical protein